MEQFMRSKKTTLIVKPKRNSTWFDRYSEYITLPNILIAVGFIVTIIIGQQISNAKFQRSKAAAESASFIVLPKSAILSPSGTLEVWIRAAHSVAFIHATLSYDSSKVQLTQEPTLAAPSIYRVVSQTSLSEANSTGKLSIVLGLDPASKIQFQTGIFQFLTLNVTSITNDHDVQTTIVMSPDTAQIVNFDSSPIAYVLTSEGSTITINPTVPTQTPTPTSVPIVIGAATPTSTPLPTITNTPVPTTAPTGTPDTSAPTVTISRPANGETFRNSIYVSSRATDPESRITAIKVFFDAKLYRTCTNVTSCTAWLNTWRVSKGTHSIVVTATNQAGLTNSKAIIITKK